MFVAVHERIFDVFFFKNVFCFLPTSVNSGTLAMMRVWTTCSRCWTWRVACRPAHTDGAKGVFGKRRPRDAGRLRGRDVSVSCGHLDVFQETPFRLALRGKVSGTGEFLADQGSHETSETSFALHSRHARHASGIGSAPLTEMVGWCDGSWADLDEKRRSTTGGSVDAWRSVRGWLVSNAETNSVEQW